MSTLIVLLPPHALTASSSLEYVLANASGNVLSHGSTQPSLLPMPGGANAAVVTVVAAENLSWHHIDWPKGTPAHSPRGRAVLEGLLEDRVLDEAAELHFALAPGARPGAPATAAVCTREWLRAGIAVLEAAGRAPRRVVPQFAPTGGASERAWIIGTPEHPLCAVASAQHVVLMPLSVAAAQVRSAPQPWASVQALPAVAQAAERVLSQAVSIQTVPEQLVQAAAGGWNLAQFDLNQAGGQRTARRLNESLGRFLTAPSWQAARWACVGLLLVNLLGVQVLAWRERNALAARQQASAEVLRQTFPHVKLVLDAPVQMAREVSALRQATGATGSGDLESMLSSLAGLAPGARVDGLEYKRGELRVRGGGLEPLGDPGLGLRFQALGLQARADGRDWLLSETTRPRGGTP